MPDLHTSLGGSIYFLILFPVLVGLAVYLYRRPGHPRASASRVLLFLRISALLTAVALLVEPLFGLTVRHTRLPHIALLVDDSASMGVEEAGRQRGQAVVEILRNAQVRQALAGIGEVRAFAFAESLRTFDLKSLEGEEGPSSLAPRASPPLRWDGQATDLGGALSALTDLARAHDLSAVLLISDGAANVGTDPEKAASLLGVPVYAVGVGDPAEPKDVAVVSVLCDPVGVAGEEIPIRVTIRSSGYTGRRIPMELRTSDGLLLTQSLLLEEGDQQVDLPLNLESPGRRTYEVRIPSQPDERSVSNNSAFFALDVLKGKNRVLMVSGSPNPDFSYLRRLIASDKHKEVDVLIAAGHGGLSREDAARLSRVKDYDLVVLTDLPASALARAERALVDFVRTGGGLLMLGGRNAFDGGYGTSALRDLLPVRPVAFGPSFEEDRFQVEFPEMVHPILRFSEDPEADARARAEWPPLLGFNRTLGARPGAVVLAVHPRLRTPDDGRMPVITVAAFGAGRVAAISCATIYRLESLMWGIGKTGETPAVFWKNVFQWLLTPENARRVTILPDRPIWKNGEPVTLRASVYDALMRPLRGGGVTVSVSDTLGAKTATLVESGEGHYIGQIRGLAPGEHRFEGRAEVDGAEVGRDAGSFAVSAVGLEFESLRMNEHLLRRIAGVSGGAFCRPETLPSLIAGLKLPPQTVSETYRAQVWGNPYALALFVALLAAEWTLRRRRGML